MGYNYHYSASDDSILQDWNKFNNYSRKVPHNPMPSFKFPGPLSTNPTTSIPLTTAETTTVDEVSKLIKDIFTSTTATNPTTSIPLTTTAETTTMDQVTKLITDIFTPSTPDVTTTELTITTTTIQDNILNSTFSNTVGLNLNNTLDESASSNNTAIFNIMEDTTGSSMTNIIQNGSSPIDSAQNVTDLMDSGNNGSILTTISEVASSTAESTMSMLSTTTEKVTVFVTETVKQISGSTESSSHHHDEHMSHHYHDTESHRLLYIILFIIIAILVLIGIILLLIYIKYRKNSSRGLHNYYEVSPKDKTLSDLGQEEQKEVSNEVYMHYQC